MKSLHDKVVMLVTSGKIGSWSLALSLADQGADIAIVYTDLQHQQADEIKRRVEEKGRRCMIIPVKSAGKTFSRKVIGQIIDTLGRLDIFIDYGASAGTITHSKKVEEQGQDYLSNPFSNFEIMAAAIRQMVIKSQANKNKMKTDARRITMQIAQELINKPVISVKEGKELGKFHDFFLDEELESITAISLGKEGLLDRKETLIKWENVVTMGEDAVLVNEANAVLEADWVSETDDYIKRDDLIGRPIDTPGGTKIGLIGDIVIDRDAAVAGFSLSQIYVSGPIAANRAISRSAIIDTGNEDGVMTAKLAEAEKADLKVKYEGFFADPSVTHSEETTVGA